jgi:tripartite-type tricarboxylate transporter receptor subunit TctC
MMPAQADEVAEFYKGKRVNLIVSYGPGGGYDVYARVLARHIGRHIPGNPSIVVQNMPGAGSLRGANYLYNVAPKDGTAFGTFARNVAMLGIVKSGQNVQFDPAKFTWLGSSSSLANDAYALIVRRDAKVKTIEDARRLGGPPLILGSTAEGTSSDAMGILLREWLGFNLKVVAGYTDSGVLFLAIERGEVEGRTVGLSSVRANSRTGSPNGFARGDGGVRRHRFPDFPDARPRANSPRTEDRNLIEILEIPYALSRRTPRRPGCRRSARKRCSRLSWPPRRTRLIWRTPKRLVSRSVRSAAPKSASGSNRSPRHRPPSSSASRVSSPQAADETAGCGATDTYGLVYLAALRCIKAAVRPVFDVTLLTC